MWAASARRDDAANSTYSVRGTRDQGITSTTTTAPTNNGHKEGGVYRNVLWCVVVKNCAVFHPHFHSLPLPTLKRYILMTTYVGPLPTVPRFATLWSVSACTLRDTARSRSKAEGGKWGSSAKLSMSPR